METTKQALTGHLRILNIRQVFAVSLAISTSQIASCSDANPRDDKLQVGGHAFDVPRACTGTGAIFQSSARLKRDSFIVEMLLPEASCLDGSKPDTQIILPTATSRDARVLVSKIRPSVQPKKFMDDIFNIITTGHTIVPGTLKENETTPYNPIFSFKERPGLTIP